jgi:hypothetical protein
MVLLILEVVGQTFAIATVVADALYAPRMDGLTQRALC